MTRRSRLVVVAAVAVAAALGVAAGAALVGRNGDDQERPKGAPPFVVDLGVRGDREAQALRRAARLFRDGRRALAGQALDSYSSPQAQVGRALAAWPRRTRDRLEELATTTPTSGAVLFHLGLVRFWDRDRDGALAAWRLTRERDPDSVYAIRASDLLFRRFAPGVPIFILSARPDARLTRLAPARQLAVLARRARSRDVRAKLFYGLALQRLDRPVSARKQYTAAARLAPANPEALTADAVGRFDKARPAQAFSRLGPLTRRFPHAATVRFHLGLMLLWLSRVDDAKRQLGIAARLRRSPLSREARRLLARLEDV